jgi:hypothetical protein
MDSICTVYEKTGSLSARRIKTYICSADKSNVDMAMSHAITNTDKNLFYFTFPDLSPKQIKDEVNSTIINDKNIDFWRFSSFKEF